MIGNDPRHMSRARRDPHGDRTHRDQSDPRPPGAAGARRRAAGWRKELADGTRGLLFNGDVPADITVVVARPGRRLARVPAAARARAAVQGHPRARYRAYEVKVAGGGGAAARDRGCARAFADVRRLRAGALGARPARDGGGARRVGARVRRRLPRALHGAAGRGARGARSPCASTATRRSAASSPTSGESAASARAAPPTWPSPTPRQPARPRRPPEYLQELPHGARRVRRDAARTRDRDRLRLLRKRISMPRGAATEGRRRQLTICGGGVHDARAAAERGVSRTIVRCAAGKKQTAPWYQPSRISTRVESALRCESTWLTQPTSATVSIRRG